MAQEMPPTPKPGFRLSRMTLAEHRLGGSGQVPGGMIEIKHRYGTMGKAGAIDPPKPPSAVTEPNDLWGRLEGLALGFQLELRDELVDIPQHRHQSAVKESGNLDVSPREAGA